MEKKEIISKGKEQERGRKGQNLARKEESREVRKLVRGKMKLIS